MWFLKKIKLLRGIFKNANIFFNIILIDTLAFTIGSFAT